MKKWQKIDEFKGIFHEIEYYRERAEKAVRIGFSKSRKSWEEILLYPMMRLNEEIESETEEEYEEEYWQ